MRKPVFFIAFLLASCSSEHAALACVDRDDDKIAQCMAGCAPGSVGAFSGRVADAVEECLAQCSDLFCLRSAWRTRSGTWCASAKTPGEVKACRNASENHP